MALPKKQRRQRLKSSAVDPNLPLSHPVNLSTKLLAQRIWPVYKEIFMRCADANYYTNRDAMEDLVRLLHNADVSELKQFRMESVESFKSVMYADRVLLSQKVAPEFIDGLQEVLERLIQDGHKEKFILPRLMQLGVLMLAYENGADLWSQEQGVPDADKLCSVFEDSASDMGEEHKIKRAYMQWPMDVRYIHLFKICAEVKGISNNEAGAFLIDLLMKFDISSLTQKVNRVRAEKKGLGFLTDLDHRDRYQKIAANFKEQGYWKSNAMEVGIVLFAQDCGIPLNVPDGHLPRIEHLGEPGVSFDEYLEPVRAQTAEFHGL